MWTTTDFGLYGQRHVVLRAVTALLADLDEGTALDD
jgi:hypothetical protein